MSLYHDFFNGKESLLLQTCLFDEHYSFGLIPKLQKESNKTDFLATITELNFGLLFHGLCDGMKYNYPLFPGLKLRPDWTLTMGGQTIVAEVLRLNATEADQRFIDFDTILMNELECISLAYVLKINYESEEFDISSIDRTELRVGVENWLLKKRGIGDVYPFSHGLIEVEQTEGLTEKRVGVMGGFRSIDHKPYRLMGEHGRLMEKVNKYGPVSAAHNLPLIICIYLHFESWLQPEDIYKGLYGLLGQTITRISLKGKIEGSQHHDLSDALYYSNQEMKQNVSGILIRQNDTHYYFPNHYHLNRISDDNEKLLKLSCTEFAFP